MKYDIAIVGGGPAGISAALKLAKENLQILIIDENSTLGGKLPIQLHEENNNQWWNGKSIANEMINELRTYKNVHILLNTQVWNIEPGFKLYMSSDLIDLDEYIIEASIVILATGAIENGIPIAGWTKPGVLTVGGAQSLLNHYLVKPGNHVAIVGLDMLSLAIAINMKMLGIDVVGIFLPPKNPFTEEIADPDKVLKNLTHLKNSAPNIFLKMALELLNNPFIRKIAASFPFGIRVNKIPIYLQKYVTEICGEETVTHIKVKSKNGAEENLNVDCVCLSGGLVPQTELAVLAKCDFALVPELNGKVPIHNEFYESTVENLYLAGNITGIESAKICIEQGKVVALSILKKLNLLKDLSELEKAITTLEMKRANAIVQFNPNIQKGKTIIHQLWSQTARKEYEHDKSILS